MIILGILSAVFLPKVFITKNDSDKARAKVQVHSIISAIAIKKNENLLTHQDTTFELENKDLLFENVLNIGISQSKSNGWTKQGNKYILRIGDEKAIFKFDKSSFKFDCAEDNGVRVGLCKELMQ